MGKILMHWTYLEMVCKELETVRHLDKMQSKLSDELEGVPVGTEKKKDLSELWAHHYLPTRGESIIKVMLLSALMLEAYINNVAKQKLPGFERDALDKLDVAAKWVIIPRLAFGTGPEAGSELIQRIKQIQKHRNFLAHAKPMETNCDESDRLPPMDVNRAENAAKTCFDALAEIQRIAPDFEKRYFNDSMPKIDRIRELISQALTYETNNK